VKKDGLQIGSLEIVKYVKERVDIELCEKGWRRVLNMRQGLLRIIWWRIELGARDVILWPDMARSIDQGEIHRLSKDAYLSASSGCGTFE
jgi:hypothetical protein